MTPIENQNVLVAYATKYGATAEIADRIGQLVRQAGLPVDVRPVKEVSDLGTYQAVILGSAVYIGRWRKEAVKFLEKNEQALAERPVWLFSSGPTGEGNPVELLKGWRYPDSLQPLIDRIQPHDVAVFHGDLALEKVNFLERTVIQNVKAPLGDFRDWQAITDWATTIADSLKQPVA